MINKTRNRKLAKPIIICCTLKFLEMVVKNVPGKLYCGLDFHMWKLFMLQKFTTNLLSFSMQNVYKLMKSHKVKQNSDMNLPTFQVSS